MYFTLSSAYNRYGCWGLTDDYTNPERNYKMQAMRNILNKAASISKTNEWKTISIYPNSAGNYLEINLGNTNPLPKKSEIEICNLLGETLMRMPAEENSRINISELPAGMYYLKIGEMMGRFVKE